MARQYKLTKVCENCAQEYRADHENRRFCNHACFHKFRAKEGAERRGIVRCQHCLTPFQRNVHSQKYCCKQCSYDESSIRRKAVRDAKAWRPEKVQCPNCSRAFTQRSPNHQYCKYECLKALKREKTYLRLLKTARRDCKTCGAILEKLGNTYCSEKCRNKQKYVARQIYENSCAFCEKTYKTGNPRSIHCSKECNNKACNARRSEDRRILDASEDKRAMLAEKQKNRFKSSRFLPAETNFSAEISKFLASGGQIRQFHAEEEEVKNPALPHESSWVFDL